MTPTQRVGAGMSATGLSNLAVVAVTTEMSAAGAVLGGVIGLLISRSAKGAGVGGAIGAVVGAAFGGWTGYEAKQGVTA